MPLIGLAAAFVFAAQMLNFPVAGGTSGHLIGGVLAAVLLGPSAAVVVLSSVLILQCLLFVDGGLTALGANIFSMALVAPVIGYGVYFVVRRAGGEGLRGRLLATGFAAWCSTVAASVVCAGELAASGTVIQQVKHYAEVFGRRIAARAWPPLVFKRKAFRDYLRRLFALLDVDCVIDVGANRGQYYRFLRYWVGFGGRIVSVEPIASLAQGLARKARFDSKWTVVQCALGATCGAGHINVMAQHSFSSILAPDASHTAQFKDLNSVARVEEIAIRTLDDVWPGTRSLPRTRRAAPTSSSIPRATTWRSCMAPAQACH